MRHKFPKIPAILASLVVLTPTLIYYADSRSVPETAPRPAQSKNRQVLKPAQPDEKAILQPKSPPAANKTIVEATQETVKTPLTDQNPGEPPWPVETELSAEPKTVSPPIAEVSRSATHTYADPVSQTDDPNLILWEKAFKPAGFSWGNSYSDSMHFELPD